MKTSSALNRGAALCLVAAPILLTVADGLQIISPDMIGWTVVLWLAFVFFVPVLFTLSHLLRPHTPRMALAAGAITLLGAMAGAAMQVYFRTLVTLDQLALDPALTASVVASLQASSPLQVTTLIPGALFPVGLLLFSILLVQTRVVPLPPSMLLGIGAVLFPIGHAVGVAAALIGGDLVLLFALAWIAKTVYTHPEQWIGEQAELGAKAG